MAGMTETMPSTSPAIANPLLEPAFRAAEYATPPRMIPSDPRVRPSAGTQKKIKPTKPVTNPATPRPFERAGWTTIG